MKAFWGSKWGKIITISAIGIVVVVIAVIVGINLVDNGYRTITVEEAIGTVTVENETEGSFAAYEGMHLVSGDEVTVGDESSLALRLDKDKYVVADSGTHFYVEASGDGEKKTNMRTYIYMDSGSILNRLDEKLGEGEIYEVQTPNSTAAVRGTTFRVTVYGGGSLEELGKTSDNYTKIDVLTGVVKVDLKTEDGELTGESRNFEAGESALIHSNTEVSEFVDGTKTDDSVSDEHIHTEIRNLVKESTCMEDGLEEITCSECKAFLGAEIIEKTGHTEGEWTVTKEATCMETGTKTMLCADCKSVMEEEKIPLTEHNFEQKTSESKNKCTTTTTVKNICSVCKKEEVVSNTSVTNHTYGDWTTETEATCSSEGVSKRVCSICGKTENQSIAKLEHTTTNGVWQTVKTPTCMEEGSKKIECSVCGEWVYATLHGEHSTNYTAAGHNISGVNYNYTSGYQVCSDVETCSVCGESFEETHNLKVDLVINSDGTQSTKLWCATCGIEW